MAAAIENPVLGYLAFTAIKAIGYTAAAFYLNIKFGNTTLSAIKIGIVRLLIGMLFGVGVWGATWLFAKAGIHSALWAFAYVFVLLPVRCFEWHILFKWFYKRDYESSQRKYIWLLSGSFLSYLLDIPAAIGLIATAGFWVC